MEYALLGFLTSLSLILAIGAQNNFVIEQGLKNQHVFKIYLQINYIMVKNQIYQISFQNIWILIKFFRW